MLVYKNPAKKEVLEVWHRKTQKPISEGMQYSIKKLLSDIHQASHVRTLPDDITFNSFMLPSLIESDLFSVLEDNTYVLRVEHTGVRCFLGYVDSKYFLIVRGEYDDHYLPVYHEEYAKSFFQNTPQADVVLDVVIYLESEYLDRFDNGYYSDIILYNLCREIYLPEIRTEILDCVYFHKNSIAHKAYYDRVFLTRGFRYFLDPSKSNIASIIGNIESPDLKYSFIMSCLSKQYTINLIDIYSIYMYALRTSQIKKVI